MAGVSFKEALALREKVARLQHSTKKARQKAGEVVQEVVRTAEVGGAAFALAYIDGKRAREGKPHLDIFGVPGTLAVGVGAKVAALMGVGGAEEHVKAIGDGALAAYFANVGFTAGQTGALPFFKPAGAIGPTPSVKGAALTAEDLARLAE